jgi:hypothetical protein
MRQDCLEFEASLDHMVTLASKIKQARRKWLVSVILATWEAEIRRMEV